MILSGDLHIGRSSSRAPDRVRREDMRAAAAWSRIVDLAIREQADVVCLSGDIADETNRFFEAIGPLEQGVRRLAEAEIRTVAVAGNHDHDVLVRLADQLPGDHFTLLGRGGVWERLTIEKAGQPALHIDGWSFPRAQVHHSPLDGYSLDRDPAVPVLGLVHGDLNAAVTPYASLDLARLQDLAPAGWLLGHIHSHHLVAEADRPWVLYPGSPQALDPGETGAHGPWVVEVSGGALGVPEHRPISSIWYGQCMIDVSSAADETELEALLLDCIREEVEDIAVEAGPHLTHISLRLRLGGSTPVSRDVPEVARRVTEDLYLQAGSASVGVEKIDVETTPPIDLEEYAGTHSAPGAVARLLLELNRPEVSEDVAGLIREARSELERVERQKDFTQLKRREVTDKDARDHLQTQARALLTQLLSQTV